MIVMQNKELAVHRALEIIDMWKENPSETLAFLERIGVKINSGILNNKNEIWPINFNRKWIEKCFFKKILEKAKASLPKGESNE